jgi:hypothetical protein
MFDATSQYLERVHTHIQLYIIWKGGQQPDIYSSSPVGIFFIFFLYFTGLLMYNTARPPLCADESAAEDR